MRAKISISQREGRCSSSHTAIIAVEQSVQRLVQQDAVDGIRRLTDVWRQVFLITKKVTVPKMLSLLLIQMLPLITE